MNEAKEILDALPKSREYYTTVRSAELARLREIAACFEKGDAERIEALIECHNFIGEDETMIFRLQDAAMLAEDGA